MIACGDVSTKWMDEDDLMKLVREIKRKTAFVEHAVVSVFCRYVVSSSLRCD